jgi:fumarate reductase iron-sulfur subunit
MPEDINQISILTRREIEARIAGPLIKAFMEELGSDKALMVVKRVIEPLAWESGNQLAIQMGGNSMHDFAKGMKTYWESGGAYEKEELELSETKYDFNVKLCRYAEMYKELGLAELGFVISCGRDFDMIKGFNPKMTLVRTKTIMEGHDICDFRITLK